MELPFYGAVSYNQEKVDAKQVRILGGSKMIENTTGKEELVFGQTLRSFESRRYFIPKLSLTTKQLPHLLQKEKDNKE